MFLDGRKGFLGVFAQVLVFAAGRLRAIPRVFSLGLQLPEAEPDCFAASSIAWAWAFADS